jgi:hypothetical protein
MKTLMPFIALLALMVAFAGCTSQQNLPAQSTTTVQSATSTTAPVSSTPAPTTATGVIVPDDVVGGNPDPGTLNDVAIDTRTLG